MFGSLRQVTCLSSRRLYATEAPKVPAALIGQLRKLTEVSITKAREALGASNNDINLALSWLEKDLVTSGAAKAAKLEGRSAGEGVISTAVLSRGAGSLQKGLRAAMVELNCETDFVGRTEHFARLAADIAHTAAFISEQHGPEVSFQEHSLDMLNDAPLISESSPNPATSVTVGSSIRDLIAKVGEKISLRRAVSIVNNPAPQQGEIGLRLGSYNHGGTIATQGRIGSLALLALKSPKLSELLASEAFIGDLSRLERSLARQIAGFPTASVKPVDGEDAENALYNQQFMMLPDYATDTVGVALEKWGLAHGLGENALAVVEFKKWTVGQS